MAAVRSPVRRPGAGRAQGEFPPGRAGQLSPRARRAVEKLGQVGGIARGTVFATAGIFLVVAAAEVKPGKAKGVDSSLRALAHTPLGPWLLVVVATGLVIFGVYSLCEARWRRV